jgi:hypothetical protein
MRQSSLFGFGFGAASALPMAGLAAATPIEQLRLSAGPMMPVRRGRHARGRGAIGKVGVAGDKLARKVAKGRLYNPIH